MLRQTKKLLALQKVVNPFCSYKYLRGFRNTFAVEISEGYLPKHTNPKLPPHNLVTE